MKRNTTIIIMSLAIIPLIFSQCSPKSRNAPQLGRDSIDDVIKAMTLDEKASFVIGTGMDVPVGVIDSETKPGPVVGNTKRIVPGAAGTTFAIERLGIPAIVLADGPAGLRIDPQRDNDSNTYYCTAYPIATALASSWNVDLVEEAGKSIGNEVKEYGVDVLLAPALNIHRHPLSGRNFEYYSEDPLISGKMAAAMVRGIQSNGVGTSIKHFAANNQETERMGIDTKVSQRALREIYLKGFEITVQESSPWTVMSSYNKINGVAASESVDLLTNILREDWKYKGLVMTDWFGGTDPVLQMIAGNDLLMPGTLKQKEAIIAGIKDGSLDEKYLDKNIKRILELVLESPRFKGITFSNKPDLKKHADVSREIATEGMVLLKNENKALPLNNVKEVAVFGVNSYNFIAGGTGSGDVNKAYTVSLIEGLENGGYNADQNLTKKYTQYINIESKKVPKQKTIKDPIIAIEEMAVSNDVIENMANINDVALISIGRISGEFRDRTLLNEKYNIGDYYLTKTEKDLIKNVSKIFSAKGKKTILILNIGGTIELTEINDAPNAILLAWQPGQEAGNAVVDILSGKVNPSGKLATTFLANIKNASGKSFPGTPLEKPTEVVYDEDIYVGYRYYDKFKVKPLYEFGYGLSYTTFQFSDCNLVQSDNSLKLSVTVKNTGKISGKEVVQIYIASPKVKLEKPLQELRAFGKTKLLESGESQILSFELKYKDFASFDSTNSSWTVEHGEYSVNFSNSSRSVKETRQFKLNNEVIVGKVSNSLIPL